MIVEEGGTAKMQEKRGVEAVLRGIALTDILHTSAVWLCFVLDSVLDEPTLVFPYFLCMSWVLLF